jgi:hypothetical protein
VERRSRRRMMDEIAQPFQTLTGTPIAQSFRGAKNRLSMDSLGGGMAKRQLEVTCAVQRSSGTRRELVALGGLTEVGKRWRLDVAEVVALLAEEKADFLLSAGGSRALLCIEGDAAQLRTTLDKGRSHLLLTLPSCP